MDLVLKYLHVPGSWGKGSDKRLIYFVRCSWPKVIFTERIVSVLTQHLYVDERNNCQENDRNFSFQFVTLN
jgi:hypothetical protein